MHPTHIASTSFADLLAAVMAGVAQAQSPVSCIAQKADFSGTQPLIYRSVEPVSASKVYIGRTPSKECVTSGESKCSGATYVVAGDKVLIGKECGGWAYIQHMGTRRVSYGWVSTTALSAVPEAESGHTDQSSNGLERPDQKYSFQLTKGHGEPVCEAYLQRLNRTVSRVPPYCDRPESDVVTGFSRLKRFQLTAGEYNRLAPQVWQFTHGDPMVDPPNLKDCQVGRETWLYSPLIDIENNGRPREVLIWNGYGASGYRGACGDIGLFGLPDAVGLRQVQIAYILTPDKSAVDDKETRRVFGRPATAYEIANPSATPYPFRPIGRSIGIFKYRDTYCFDTFFDGTGDFHDQRKEDPRISNTLGVFEHHGGITNQVCELRMAGHDFDNSFFLRMSQ